MANTDPDASRHDAEFAALRATIRERGTVRLALVPVVFIGWAAVAVATAAVITVAISTLVPLMVLVAGFEAVFALHVSVERVGRYLQVFHERSGEGWEHAAMRIGDHMPAGPDPLSIRIFIFATSINFFPAALGGTAWEVVVIGICHLGFIVRLRKAQRFAALQRGQDLEGFRTLRQAMSGSAATAGPGHPPGTTRPND